MALRSAETRRGSPNSKYSVRLRNEIDIAICTKGLVAGTLESRTFESDEKAEK